ncbi:MAG TPA: class I SAM-dependent methyltransferase [Chthoniobacterales bacterium]|nr:class I SAM-dependent methyltransferase [Chthoniobacterales bacterium]
MSFKDHFSKQAADYAKFRPRYPRALFEFVAAQSPNNECAVDVATGNGQAAVALAEFFRRVIALDASGEQIASAQPNERVNYRVAPAEATGLASQSCAALTVAQALHWFHLEKFFCEARRVLQPRGIVAVWTYNELRISPEIDEIVRRFHDQVVGRFWPPERRMVGRGYLALSFPFEEIETPPFEISVLWSLGHLLGYLRTWSATQRFIQANERDPVSEIQDELAARWGDAKTERLASWPLTTRIGRA